MAGYVYETHSMADPLLPFIFHREFKVARRQGIPNWHENIEILYCIGGNGSIQCGAKVYDFACGDIFLVNADTLHSIRSEESVSYQCLIIDNRFWEANGIPISQLYFQSRIRDEELNGLYEAVSDAIGNRESGHICAVADIRWAVLNVMRLLCRKYVRSRPKGLASATSGYVKKAMTYIRKNLAQPLSLEHVARHVGISKYYLAREFKAFTGKTIVQTVNLIRCTEAKRLIEGGMRVSAAAASCGYENLSYFTRSFKKYFQKVPSAFLPDSPEC